MWVRSRRGRGTRREGAARRDRRVIGRVNAGQAGLWGGGLAGAPSAVRSQWPQVVRFPRVSV